MMHSGLEMDLLRAELDAKRNMVDDLVPNTRDHRKPYKLAPISTVRKTLELLIVLDENVDTKSYAC